MAGFSWSHITWFFTQTKFSIFFLILIHWHFFKLLLEREGRESKGNINVWEKHRLAASWTCLDLWSYTPGPGVRPANIGMCPDQEMNPQPFSYGMMLLPNEPHWPGLNLQFLNQVPHRCNRKDVKEFFFNFFLL